MPATTVIVRGAGSMGRQHLDALRGMPGVDKLAAWPAREPAPEAVTAAGSPLAVIVATDTKRHVADTLDALARGASVLVEKPLAVDANAARALLAVDGAERRVFVGCVLRFQRALAAFIEWLPDIGAVHAVRIECQTHLPDWRPGRDHRSGYSARADEGGVLRDLIHEVDYATWIFGAPARVRGQLATTGRLGIQAEESADLAWTAPSGPQVSMRLDYLTQPRRRTMVADGALGSLRWDGIAQRVELALADGSSRSRRFRQARERMVTEQDRAFLRAVAGRDPGPLASLRDGIMALAVCDAARRSSDRGAWEAVQAGD
ncbi:MAG: Gfo/Idh/MocA family oxidoreductase [Chloroflexota bacterium]